MVLCELDIHLLQPVDVTRLELGALKLSYLRQQAILQAEGIGLDQKITRNLIAIEIVLCCDLLQRATDSPLHLVGPASVAAKLSDLLFHGNHNGEKE